MNIQHEDELLVVRLVPGEEVMSCLTRLAAEAGLPGAEVSAIGAVERARIGFFRTNRKQYDVLEFEENLEVVSLLGSLAHGPDGPIVHLHAALGRADGSLVGGHLFEATVSVTLEVFVRPTGRLERRRDPRFDLHLLALADAGR